MTLAENSPREYLTEWSGTVCSALRTAAGRGAKLVKTLMPADVSSHAADHRRVRAALRGSQAAADELTRRMGCIPAMVRSKNAKLGSPLDTNELEDVAQSTFVKVWARLETFEGRSTLETWVYGFCVNELFKGIHKKRRYAGSQQVDEAELQTFDEDPPDGARPYEWVYAGLERLGAPASDVIRLKHFEQLTFEQIARRMKMSPNTAKTHYFRGVRKLEIALGRYWRAEQR